MDLISIYYLKSFVTSLAVKLSFCLCRLKLMLLSNPFFFFFTLLQYLNTFLKEYIWNQSFMHSPCLDLIMQIMSFLVWTSRQLTVSFVQNTWYIVFYCSPQFKRFPGFRIGWEGAGGQANLSCSRTTTTNQHSTTFIHQGAHVDVICHFPALILCILGAREHCFSKSNQKMCYGDICSKKCNKTDLK